MRRHYRLYRLTANNSRYRLEEDKTLGHTLEGDSEIAFGVGWGMIWTSWSFREGGDHSKARVAFLSSLKDWLVLWMP